MRPESNFAVPVANRVLVRIENRGPEERNGIIVPGNFEYLAETGVVVALGAGRISKKGTRVSVPELRVGDHVAFGKYAGVEIKLNDQDHIMMFADDIHGLVERNACAD